MIAVILVVACSSSSVTYASWMRSDSFCKKRIIHNYGRRLPKVPKGNRYPPTDHLPFAPKSVSFIRPTKAVLVAAGRPPYISYSFAVPSGEFLQNRIAWKITSYLVEVNTKGEINNFIDAHHIHINATDARGVDGQGFTFELNSAPKFYRVQTDFRSQSGSLLGRYFQYFRVVPPTRHTVLVADRLSVRPGETLTFRLENIGTLPVTFGEPFSIDRLLEDAWTPYPVDLGPWHWQRLSLGAGEAGKCQQFIVPADTSPGQYRIRKSLFGRVPYVTTVFRVIP